ncbi:hypothetical protein [Leptospira interrogans]|uniref:hypothetical protein n=1 Tax=Leptospira interrogans TaxID=173 RepID=UPI0002BBEE31|nr:hypothetical protein [Leptospira interrogans]
MIVSAIGGVNHITFSVRKSYTEGPSPILCKLNELLPKHNLEAVQKDIQKT